MPEDEFPADEPQLIYSFPGSDRWELTRSNALRWARTLFPRVRERQLTRSRLNEIDQEILLLIRDLELYGFLCRDFVQAVRDPAGPLPAGLRRPPPIEEFLRPGREHWGRYARLSRAWIREQKQCAK